MRYGSDFKRMPRTDIFWLKMKNELCIVLMSFMLICGCSDKKEAAAHAPEIAKPSPVERNALQAINECREAREINALIISVQEGLALMQTARRGCEDYLYVHPAGEYRNEASLILVEATQWYQYYYGQVIFEKLVSENNLDAASEQLEKIREKISEQKYVGYKKLIDDHVKQAAMDQMETRMPGLSEYAKKLRLDFGNRISYDSDFAEDLIETLYLDCNSRDGRVLPVANILHARLASLNTEKMHLEIEVETRDEGVRVHDRLVENSGKLVHKSVAYHINKWGDIRPINHSIEAVYNACFSGWGEIWVIPKK